ncbi:MAG TPA: hypothetical protein VJS39_00625 [Gemmatimonadaceae bacterium]|nr:hypothetical protein [Gemmatimonadaceae bacterium]
MQSPAAAIAWEFRARHRWGMLGVILYIIVLAAIKLSGIARGVPLYTDSSEAFAFMVMVPLTSTATYFLAVFTFGLDGDLAARQSMYPTRRLTLPVTTTALAFWPMVYGSAAMVTLWLAVRTFATWPAGFVIPWFWPMFLATSLLVWTQALTWMPYPVAGLRIIATVFWLTIIDTTALIALHFNVGEWVMIGILAPQIPLAYVVARYSVARARCGAVADWRTAFSLPGVGDFRRELNLTSPGSAQAWFEWRRHGWSLPTWVAILLPFELLLLWGARDSASLAFTILLGVLLTPPFVATFAAAAVSTSSSDAGESSGSAFIATRPLTDAQLVAAKLKMAARSTLVTWIIVIVCVPVALKISGTSGLVRHAWQRDSEILGMARAVVLSLLILAACIAATWTQMIQSLYIGLTGRASVIKASVFLTIGFVFLFGPFFEWITDKGRLGVLWSALPLVLSVLAAAKMSVVIWLGQRLFRQRLVSDRALVTGAAMWSLTVLALYAVLAWLLDAPHIPHYLLMLIAILAIPIARVSAAPVALASSRHR